MKRAIKVGLVVLGGGLLLLWKAQHDGWPFFSQGTDTGRSGNGPTAVEKIYPVMPPVIELTGQEQGVDETNTLHEPVSSSIGLDAEVAAEVAGQGMLTTEGTNEESGSEENILGEKSYDPGILDAVLCAEKKADFPALKVLQIGREMSLESKEVVQGGCWNYVDTVYNRAGYSEQKRQVVFQGERETGLYADREMIRPGDWLFYINHDYREARHSAIFVDWLDYEKQIGLMLSYGGKERGEPARYSAYDLSHVYNIIRPLDE